MSACALPRTFARTITEVYGARGVAWLQAFPTLLEACAAQWGLALAAPLSLSYNYVAPAKQRDGSRVVLKLGVPDEDLLTEVAALQHFDGHGCVRLLDVDAEVGALLLECLEPGTSLERAADDEAAVCIAADVMRALWRPAPADHAFPEVADWLEAFMRLRSTFDGGTGPLPGRLIDRAEILSRDLLGSADAAVLLHGDLHHGNILCAWRTPWLAIDPKGVVGEPSFDVGAFLLNPKPQPEQVLARRVEVFAERISLDRERIRGWCGRCYRHAGQWKIIMPDGRRRSSLRSDWLLLPHPNPPIRIFRLPKVTETRFLENLKGSQTFYIRFLKP